MPHDATPGQPVAPGNMGRREGKFLTLSLAICHLDFRVVPTHYLNGSELPPATRQPAGRRPALRPATDREAADSSLPGQDLSSCYLAVCRPPCIIETRVSALHVGAQRIALRRLPLGGHECPKVVLYRFGALCMFALAPGSELPLAEPPPFDAHYLSAPFVEVVDC